MRNQDQNIYVMLAIIISVALVRTIAAAPRPRVTVEEGTCRLVRNGSVLNLKEGIQWRWVEAGDRLVTADKSRAVMQMGDCGEVVLPPKSAVQVVTMNLPEKKGTGQAELHHQEGRLITTVGVGGKGKSAVRGRCDVRIKVGKTTVRGFRYVAETSYLNEEKSRYHVSIPTGLVRLDHESGLMTFLGSGVTVDEGPPVTITADRDNETILSYSQAGSVVYALFPGQTISIERVEEGFMLTNRSEEVVLHAIEWDGAPAVKISPGQQRLFPITEREVSEERNQQHTVLLSRILRETYPVSLAGLGGRSPRDRGRVISRQDAFNQVLRYPIRRRGAEESPSR
jgi:hypothetical protein